MWPFFQRRPRDSASRAPASNVTFDRVFARELEIIGASPGPDSRPSSQRGLAGLALSGGGIRSATFNLGVLMGLHRAGVLRHFDYLSTVSGGGYIGACLSHLHRLDAQEELLGVPEGSENASVDRPAEARMLSHLRNHSSYLVVGGLMAWARMGSMLLAGILVNLLLLLPLLLLMAAIGSLATIARLDEQMPAPMATTLTLSSLWALVALLSPLWARDASARWRARLDHLGGLLVVFVPVAGFLEAQPFLLRGLRSLSEHGVTGASGGVLLLSLLGAARVGDLLARTGGILRLLAMPLVALLGLLIMLSLYLPLAAVAAFPPQELAAPPWTLASYYAIAGLCLLLLFTSLDVNATSLHRFYRDRLCQAFVIDLASGRPARTVKLSQLEQRPYHLINATMNLQGIRDQALRQRRSDFFLLSPGHIGSDRTGYVDTRVLERVVPEFALDSAVAISGAAAAPNMGIFTNRAMVLLMGLLNVRMGYWLPNPARMGRQHPGVDFFYRELAGRLSERSSFVNISDGGHLENTGIYQLLRRRCRFIVFGDGEADETMEFPGFADMLRYARVDLGVEIDIDLRAVRSAENGLSTRHCALGIIRYPARDELPPELGFLLYIKSSLTGDEGVLLDNYKAIQPAFPHETTVDQFFSEVQFEAYRALGQHIVDDLMARNRERVGPDGLVDRFDFQALFPALAVQLAPRATARRSSEWTFGPERMLATIRQALAQPDLRLYFPELYPETPIPGRSEVPVDLLPSVQPIIETQLALMERILLEEDLDRPRRQSPEAHRGWLNLFQRWARSNTFRRAWLHLAPTRDTRLQIFGREQLGLQDFFSWRQHQRASAVVAQDESDLPFDHASPVLVPVDHVPPELLPDRETLERHSGVRRMRLHYSIALQPTAAADDQAPESTSFHTTIIGYALLREHELCWLRLRPGYRGVYFFQRAISSLRSRLGQLRVQPEVLPEHLRAQVATDLCSFEDANAAALQLAYERWEQSGGRSGVLRESELPGLAPTSFY